MGALRDGLETANALRERPPMSPTFPLLRHVFHPWDHDATAAAEYQHDVVSADAVVPEIQVPTPFTLDNSSGEARIASPNGEGESGRPSNKQEFTFRPTLLPQWDPLKGGLTVNLPPLMSVGDVSNATNQSSSTFPPARETMNADDANTTLAQWKRSRIQEVEG